MILQMSNRTLGLCHDRESRPRSHQGLEVGGKACINLQFAARAREVGELQNSDCRKLRGGQFVDLKKMNRDE